MTDIDRFLVVVGAVALASMLRFTMPVILSRA
jgi:hypothetical protein